jgi:hypothetical protein
MKKSLFSLVFIGILTCSQNAIAQTKIWSSFIDSVVTLSSPRACDLNNDGVKDIVIGGGRDGFFSENGIMALDGVNGNLLWKHSCRDEVFGSSIFQDISNDGIKDVFIVGREAQLLCINGSTGELIWDFFPYPTSPKDSGWYNFYNPQFIHDVNNDGYLDILVTNGGDHAAPSWDPNRPIGKMMVISALDGTILAEAEVLDGAETYCSPIVLDLQNNGVNWILYGTGGEYFGGSFWACPLEDFIATNSLTASIQLLQDANKGYVAPASAFKTPQGHYDFIIQAFGGTISKFQGSDFSMLWQYQHPNTQSSAAPVIGNFTGDFTPDVFAVLYKGQVPSFTDYYQLMLDGATGNPVFIDSIGAIHYASANAVDLNNDGRDEAIITVTHATNGVFSHQLHAIDFVTNSITDLTPSEAGVNIASTPLIIDVDDNNLLELFYVVKRDSLNPMGFKGFYVNRLDLTSTLPNSGIAWGSYMGSHADGIYTFESENCGGGSILSGVNVAQISCNYASDGAIFLQLQNPTDTHTFAWSTGENSQSINNLGVGTYEVLITNQLGCFEYRTFTLNNPFVLSFGGIVPPTCPGDNNGQVTVSSTGCPCMFNTCVFTWDSGIEVATNTLAHEGYNIVSIIHPNGCLVIDSVFINPVEAVSAVQEIHPIVCEGGHTGSIHLSDGNTHTLTNFSWSTGETTSSIENLSAGSYSVELTDARGCTDSLFFELISANSDTVHWQAQVLSITCFGMNDGSISIEEAGDYSFESILWWNQTTTNSVDQLSAGNYSVSITDERGCSTELEFNITEPSPLQVSLTSTGAAGENTLDGTASATATGGIPPYNYVWNDPGNQPYDMSVYLNPGWYTVIVTDANGCTISDSIEVINLITSELKIAPLHIYPNPTTGELFVPDFCIGSHFVVRDVQGRIIQEGKILNVKLELTHLSSGMYVLEVLDVDKRFSTKVVVE